MEADQLVNILSALLTPMIAILASYIAWQQYQLQHKSFNGQMYERRYVVFKSFIKLLSHIMREGTADYQVLGEFYANASEADFLFSDVISNKREELYTRGVDLVAGRERLYPRDGSPGLPIGEERSKVSQESADHLKWFFGQISETRELFKKEMRI